MDEETPASSDHSFPALTDAERDVCVGRKRRSEQSRLECAASYRETHLDLHDTLRRRKRHKLAGTGRLQERICPEHDKLLEVYCRTDQQCVCRLCIADKHRGHEVIGIKKEVAEKKIKLGKVRQKTVERIQTWEKDEQNLEQAVKAFKVSAEEAVERNKEVFTELIRVMEERRRTVEELICAKEEAVVKEAEELLERARQEITDLKKRAAELEHLQILSHMDSDINVLQRASSVSNLTEGFPMPALLVHPYCSLQLVTDAVSDLVQQLDVLWKWRFITISERVKSAGIVSSPLPTSHHDFLRNASKLTIDPNTVHDNLRLSMTTTLMAVREPERYPCHADRFERRQQALCSAALRGAPRYWEVECGGGGSWVSIAVCYKGIRRKGRKAPLFGRCPRSWALRKHGTVYEFWHDNESTCIASSFRCSRVGVYLDHGAGVLAFYNVTDNMSLIHKVQTKFTEPVYAGFGQAGVGSNIKLCF